MTNVQLNDLLINLGRSFLQYVGESWPWTQEYSDDAQSVIDGLVRRQQADAARLADFILARNGTVEPGSYPLDYADMHYVALDYLLSQLVESEQALVNDFEAVLENAVNDEAAAALLRDILQNERENLAALRKIVAARASASRTA